MRYHSTEGLLNESRILMRELNGMVKIPNQFPDECFTDMFQQPHKLECIGESSQMRAFWIRTLATSMSPSASPPSGTPRSY